MLAVATKMSAQGLGSLASPNTKSGPWTPDVQAACLFEYKVSALWMAITENGPVMQLQEPNAPPIEIGGGRLPAIVEGTSNYIILLAEPGHVRPAITYDDNNNMVIPIGSRSAFMQAPDAVFPGCTFSSGTAALVHDVAGGDLPDGAPASNRGPSPGSLV